MHCRIPLDEATVHDQLVYMDTAHLTSTHWLEDGCFWTFRDANGTHLIELPRHSVTDFSGASPASSFTQICASYVPHRPCRTATPYSELEDLNRSSHDQHFHHSRYARHATHPEGDFQRIVVDALTAIWARISRCRCSSRASVRAS